MKAAKNENKGGQGSVLSPGIQEAAGFVNFREAITSAFLATRHYKPFCHTEPQGIPSSLVSGSSVD
jgi:hypothetical protein